MNKTALIGAAAVVATGLTAVGLGGSAGADATGLTEVGRFDSGSGDGGAEIVAVDTDSQRMFITNGAADRVDIVDISDPATPVAAGSFDITPYGSGIQSVATGGGVVAAAIEGFDALDNGTVVTFDADGNLIADYEVGNLPDSIAFTDDGRYIVVANEAEPVCDPINEESLLEDPEGSISIIDTQKDIVRTADFSRWIGKEDRLRSQGVRIFFPGSNAAQDLEPEYVSIIGNTAYVTLQEANAVAVLNIKAAKVTKIVPLGYKDHSIEGNGLDPSNEDGGINIATYDVLGMYMPDAIAATHLAGDKYFLTANEGDSRDYDCYSEEERVKDFGLGDDYDDALEDDALLGRLKTTTAFPTTFDDAGQIEQVYAYGARSFTIWNPAGKVVFDSGDDFEQILANSFPQYFVDNRSDDKGPEPEALAIGHVDGHTYAFVGLERSGGIMMYDISDPANSYFVEYVNTLDDGDISPEGIAFVSADDSPTGEALLVVSHEVSGTTTIFEVS